MDTPRKVPVSIHAGFLGSGKTTLLSRVLTEGRGTGRVQGYLRCKREYPDGRRRTQRSR